MDSREAYDAIRAAVAADPRKQILESFYDEQHFGSFIVSFEEGSDHRCIVNDRGFAFLAEGLDGTGDAVATVRSLYECDHEDLLQALRL